MIRSIALFLLLLVSSPASAFSNADAALAVQVNQARICDGLQPIRWNTDLWQTGRVLVQDEQYRGCFRHDGCKSGTFVQRIDRFYPGNWGGGEVIAAGQNDSLVQGWLNSAPHAAILLGPYQEIGMSTLNLQTSFGKLDFGAGDLGYRGLFPIPKIPELLGAVVGDKFMLSYWSTSPPSRIGVTVGGTFYPLTLQDGSPEQGIYVAPFIAPTACDFATFEATSSAGDSWTWPFDQATGLPVGPLCPLDPLVLEHITLSAGKTLTFTVKGVPVKPDPTFHLDYPGGTIDGVLRTIKMSNDMMTATAKVDNANIVPTKSGYVNLRIGTQFAGHRWAIHQGKFLKVKQ